MGAIKLNSEDFVELKDIIDLNDKSKLKIVYNSCFNTLWLMDEYETELYLKSGYKGDLIISRICFKNHKIGIGTKVLIWLLAYANKKGYSGITVESVCSKEMNMFCKKHKFEKVKNTGIETEELWFGNYYLSL